MKFLFPKSIRLLKRKEFVRISHDATRLIGRCISIDLYLTNANQTRLGITVSRKYGKAHKRNRFKRIVREAFRLSQHEIPKGFDMIIKPRYGAENACPQDIVHEFRSLFKVLSPE